MGGKSKPPPPPDYSGIAAASSQSAAHSYELGRQQLDWARETYAKDSERLDRQEGMWQQLIDDSMRRQDESDATARADRARYERIFQPLEEELVRDAEGYTDTRNRARAESAAGRAASDVSQQAALARAAAQDRLESYGIDPSQTRSQALDLSARVQEAAARAGAANVTREGVQRAEEATGRALRSEALNIGRGYPGQIAQQYGTALQAGELAGRTGMGAVGAGLQTTASGANTMGTGLQWTGAGNTALNTWGSALGGSYQNQLAYTKAKNENSSGWGSALGLAGGIGLKMLNPFKLFADEGGRIPEEMSPSHGVEIDDVAGTIQPNGGALRVTAGEFIVPKETVTWLGEKHFQKLIEKSKEEKAKAKAKPEVRALPVESPTVVRARREPALALG
jgi:hypothetical protein